MPPMSVTMETEQEESRSARPSVDQILEATGVLAAVGTLALGFLGTIPDHPPFEVGREVFGDIPAPLVVMFYFGLAAFLWLTFHLFAQRAASWQQGRSDDRTGLWGERLKRLSEGLTMKTVMRELLHTTWES